MHTKTPWTLTTVQTSCGICHKIGPFPWKDGKQNHACIYADYPGQGPIEAELLANARLIASAPDLLAALIALDECYCEAGNDLSQSERHQHRLVLMDARAAVKKATGAA